MPVDIFAPNRSRISCIWNRSNSSSIRSRKLVVAHAVEPAEILHHFPGRHAVVHGRVGGNESDLMSHHFRLRDAIEAADDGGAAGGLQHRAEDSQGGGFSGAVGAQQAVDLARRRRKAHVGKRQHVAANEIGVRFREGQRLNHRRRLRKTTLPFARPQSATLQAE